MSTKNEGSFDGGTLDLDCSPEDAVFFTVVHPVMIRSLEQVKGVLDSYADACEEKRPNVFTFGRC
jgi:hypothetical protein